MRPAPPPPPVLSYPTLPPIPDCIRNPNNYGCRDIEAAMNQMVRVMQQQGARFSGNNYHSYDDPESAAYRSAYERAADYMETIKAIAAQRLFYAHPQRLH